MSLASEIDQMGSRKKTHRGRRSKGKGKAVNHHEVARGFLAQAQAAPTPQAATAHLFNALTSLKKAQKPALGLA